MKHFLYILLCLLACTRSAYAQQWHFGVEGGYTLNSFHAPTLHTSSRSGFKAGGVVNYTFKSNFLLESGLAFERKGGTLSGSSISGQRINQVEVNNMDYLHLPFLMGYAFHLGKQFALLPQAGGYLNTGIGGSGFCSGHDPYNQPYTSAIEIFSSRNNLYYRPFSRMDAGLLFAASLQYRKYRLKVSYELGLSKIHSTYGSPENRTLGISAVYLFR